jgi:probable rRNA maturation factor
MFTFNFVSPAWFTYDKKIVDEIRRIISKVVEKAQKWTLNLVFVEPNSIKNLNNKYRNKDSVTDVLSFHYFETFDQLKKTDIAGEIVFCEEKIVLQWKEYGLWTEKEFYKLLIHSTLHILGYDHEADEEYEKMKELEERVWESIF